MTCQETSRKCGLYEYSNFTIVTNINFNIINCFREKEYGLYILTLLEERKMNQVDIQVIMKATTKLIDQAVSTKLGEAVTLLQAAGCSHVPAIEHLADTQADHFRHLKSQHLQQKFFVENFGMVKPVKIFLPLLDKDFGRVRTGMPQKRKQQSFVYISLIDQLEKLINKDDIYFQITGNKTAVDGWYYGFEDGIAYQDNALFRNKPKSIQLHIYLDEVQLCDPLGSKVKRNKLVFVYFAIGNLENQFRSSLQNIQILSIFYNSQVKDYGINELLKPVLEDVKKLEGGCQFNIKGVTQIMFGTIAAFPADNLASHMVGGFKLGFSKGFRKCRYCLGTDAEIQTKFSDRDFTIRTQETHDIQCKGLDTQEAEYFGKLYGLDSKSALNDLKYFHTIGGLVPDVMHDLFEGILPLVISEILLVFINFKKFFTLDNLNHAIRNFNYGHAEVKDKPSVVEEIHLKNKKLKQTSAQIWLLATMLPLMVASLIPSNDEHWFCFTTLLEISRMALSPSISEAEICMLESIIDEFLTSFKVCFSRRITPKMHFLVHYPRQIRLLGPLAPFWCMRYEAKHSYFKRLSHSIGNFINLPWTLAMRHQQLQCKVLHTAGSNFLTVNIETSPSQIKLIGNLECAGRIAECLNIHDFSFAVDTYKSVTIGTTVFKCNKSVVLCHLVDLCSVKYPAGSKLAAFGLIHTIIKYNEKVLFLCEMYRTLMFDMHFQAYKVRKRPDNFFLPVFSSDLLDHKVFHVHKPVHLSLEVKDAHSHYVVSKTKLHNMFMPNSAEYD